MSQYYDENGEFYFPQYKDGRTKQAFKDSTDISKILRKAQKTGVITHLNKFGKEYGDFSDMPDLLTAHSRLARANEIFEQLPSEVKRDFNQSPAEFFEFANDPANVGRLQEVLPAVAEPGDYVAPSRAAEPAAIENPPDPPLESGELASVEPVVAEGGS